MASPSKWEVWDPSHKPTYVSAAAPQISRAKDWAGCLPLSTVLPVVCRCLAQRGGSFSLVMS